MNIDSSIFTYLFVVILLTLTPGADTMLVIRNVMERGQKAGFYTALGISYGLCIHAVLSCVGLSYLLMHNDFYFEMIKYIGAIYLVYLGLHSLLRIYFKKHNEKEKLSVLMPALCKPSFKQKKSAFFEGLITNILNPKVFIFYIAFLPQFINSSANVFIQTSFLVSIHILSGLIWLNLISFLLEKGSEFINNTNFRMVLEGFSSIVLILLGVKLFFEKIT